jgi:L-cysteine S-thiosulfotransferase
MRRAAVASFSILVLVLLAGCAQGVKSPAGFRLPDGDPQRGRAVFIALKCSGCHQVKDVELPAIPVEMSRPVVLGGEVIYERTDGELVTSIINPSHQLAFGYPADAVTTDGRHSRMKDYSDTMTVRQLVDLVAFLHTAYKTVPPPFGKS